ncbi:MAG: hypothetical protein J1E61_03610 [Lachnospiraceae bacterium]|nr:hypothetical protein [Lachnospiraceae bacterium]
MEIFQNNDVLTRLLLIGLPVVVTFLISIGYVFAAKARCVSEELDANELKASAQLFLTTVMTSFLYGVLEILLIWSKRVSVEQVLETSMVYLAIIGILNGASCLAKGIIAGKMLPKAVGENKQQGLSKGLLYMAMAEVPGLIALVMFMIKYFT